MSVEHLPLTGSQQWLLSEMTKMNHPGYVSIEFMLKTKVLMDEDAIRKAAEFVADKYENLRVKFRLERNYWVQHVYPASEGTTFQMFDLSDVAASEQVTKMRDRCVHIRDWIKPETGDLFKIVFFKFSRNEGRIWFYMHHLISDFVSTLHVSTDFMNAYITLTRKGNLVFKPVKDYRKWQYIVDGYARDVLIPSQLEYWLNLPWHKAKTPPSDFPETFSDATSIAEAIVNKQLIDHHKELLHVLDTETTQQLIIAFGNDLESALIAVFFLTLSERFAVDCLDLTVSHSGRNVLPQHYDVSDNKLVGFIAGVRTLLLENPTSANHDTAIRCLIDQIKGIPNNGTGYSLIGKAIKDEHLQRSFHGLRKSAQILFNYLGRATTKFSNDSYELTTEDVGKDFYPREIRNSLIECILEIRNGELHYSITYIELYHTEKTIQRVLYEMAQLFSEVAHESESRLNASPVSNRTI